MNAKSNECPNCGKPAAGKFCSHCGTALTAETAPKRWSTQTVVPWAALGIAILALVVALEAWLDRGGQAPAVAPPPVAALFDSAPGAPGAPPDLSKMTPREAADRLFNRVMAASERGDTAEAEQFRPMALQAYEALGSLDDDARYHLGLIDLTAGDIKGARAQLDKIQQSAPNHLLGIMLARDIAKRSGDKVGVTRAYKGFLAVYDSEIAAGREEYQHHWGSIERFRAEAQASTTEKK
jgi:tetratricopeptide (TPR) repeat protein